VGLEVFIVVTVFLVMTSCSLVDSYHTARKPVVSAYIAINMEAADAFKTSITIARLYDIISQTTTTSINMLADKLRSCLTDELFD
jgi:hypothetical protein